MTQEEKNLNPHISIESQYIKDFSFENPGAPGSFLNIANVPNINIALDVEISRLEENRDIFEISLKIEATAKTDKNALFIIDLTYAGIFVLENIPEEQKELVLVIHCPNMIFPYARKIISDITSESGFQPLRIDPIDFARLYQNKLAEKNQEGKA
ncbi:MAG: protein-export chaperone SecB [Rickettsiaceae bacterium]|nr:protein-export chaperone SecB [Rickettsiaceae bacterium]